MGGTISVTLRNPDGAVLNMERGTNAMPGWAHDKRLYGDEAAVSDWIAGFLAGWREYLDADKDLLIDQYPGNRLLAPYGYGLIVFDLKDKVIWTCNGYTDLQQAYALAYRGDEKSWMFEAGRVRLAKEILEFPRFRYELTGEPVARELFAKSYRDQDKLNFDNLEATKAAHPDQKPPYSCMAYDLTPFTFRHYQEGKEGYLAMLADLKQSFELTPEDLAGWDEFLAD